MPKAVIFDMDGVLTDSERISARLTQEVGREMGFEIPEAVVMQTLGRTYADTVTIYREHIPNLDGQKLLEKLGERLLRMGSQGQIPLMPGVHALLDRLDSLGLPRAVASSSSPNAIRIYLTGAGILSRFDTLVSGRDCEHSKPAPDIFLLAAKRLQVNPEDCLVIEDSPSGVRAGRAAGMTVCMVPDMIPFDESLRDQCDLVLPDLNAVAERLFHG